MVRHNQVENSNLKLHYFLIAEGAFFSPLHYFTNMKFVRPTFFDVIMMLTTSSDKLCNGSNIPLFNHHPPSNFTYLFPHLRRKRLPLFYPHFSVEMLVFSYFMTSPSEGTRHQSIFAKLFVKYRR